MANPKYPVPSTVSDEAKKILATAVNIDAKNAAAPNSTDAWLKVIEDTNAPYLAIAQALASMDGLSVEKTEIAGVTVRIITPDSIPDDRQQKVLINLHGGGYALLGGELSIMESVGMALAGGFKVIAVDYRMPPLHPFPAAVDDGVAVYQALLQDYAATDIAIFGASAGGGLTASVTIAARDAGLPLPAAVVLNTPWCDLDKIGDSYFSNDGVDPVLSSYDGRLGQMASIYAGKEDFSHPLISPVYADYSKGFPPAMLVSGTRDLLLSCTVRLHRALRAANIEADLHVFEAMWHGFMTVPEGQIANAETVAFLEKHFSL